MDGYLQVQCDALQVAVRRFCERERGNQAVLASFGVNPSIINRLSQGKQHRVELRTWANIYRAAPDDIPPPPYELSSNDNQIQAQRSEPNKKIPRAYGLNAEPNTGNLARKALDVLESGTDYARALAANIDAFHRAIDQAEDHARLRRRIDELERTVDELKGAIPLQDRRRAGPGA